MVRNLWHTWCNAFISAHRCDRGDRRHSVFVLSVPVLVYFFLVWMREGDHPEHHGFLLAVAVPMAQSLAALARHRSSAASHRAGVKARTALITLTFLSAQQHTRGDGSDGDSQSAVGRFAELIGT